jgi:hypothetical protein
MCQDLRVKRVDVIGWEPLGTYLNSKEALGKSWAFRGERTQAAQYEVKPKDLLVIYNFIIPKFSSILICFRNFIQNCN